MFLLSGILPQTCLALPGVDTFILLHVSMPHVHAGANGAAAQQRGAHAPAADEGQSPQEAQLPLLDLCMVGLSLIVSFVQAVEGHRL